MKAGDIFIMGEGDVLGGKGGQLPECTATRQRQMESLPARNSCVSCCCQDPGSSTIDPCCPSLQPNTKFYSTNPCLAS